jgi:hypothetical protein
MGEGYCPSTGTYVPVQDPNQPAASSAPAKFPTGQVTALMRLMTARPTRPAPAYTQPGGAGYSG